MIPDVVDDPLTRATKALGFTYVESTLYRASLEAGYRDRSAEQAAHRYYGIWKDGGFGVLPKHVKDFCKQNERSLHV